MDWNVLIRVADDMGIETGRIFYLLLREFEGVLIGSMNRKEVRK